MSIVCKPGCECYPCSSPYCQCPGHREKLRAFLCLFRHKWVAVLPNGGDAYGVRHLCLRCGLRKYFEDKNNK